LTDAQHLNPPHFHTNPIRNPNVSSNYPPATIPPVKTSTGDTTTFQTSGGSSNATYIWDFGDGTTETTQGNTTNHNYSQPGNYNVTVKVQDTYGERIIQTYTIAVEPKGTDYLEILKVVIPLLAAGMTASVTLYIYKQNKKSKHAG
jgi:PKD repeat protein